MPAARLVFVLTPHEERGIIMPRMLEITFPPERTSELVELIEAVTGAAVFLWKKQAVHQRSALH
jgi:hypothetical protein